MPVFNCDSGAYPNDKTRDDWLSIVRILDVPIVVWKQQRGEGKTKVVDDVKAGRKFMDKLGDGQFFDYKFMVYPSRMIPEFKGTS